MYNYNGLEWEITLLFIYHGPWQMTITGNRGQPRVRPQLQQLQNLHGQHEWQVGGGMHGAFRTACTSVGVLRERKKDHFWVEGIK